jgi:hypothetical protein
MLVPKNLFKKEKLYSVEPIRDRKASFSSWSMESIQLRFPMTRRHFLTTKKTQEVNWNRDSWNSFGNRKKERDLRRKLSRSTRLHIVQTREPSRLIFLITIPPSAHMLWGQLDRVTLVFIPKIVLQRKLIWVWTTGSVTKAFLVLTRLWTAANRLIQVLSLRIIRNIE